MLNYLQGRMYSYLAMSPEYIVVRGKEVLNGFGGRSDLFLNNR